MHSTPSNPTAATGRPIPLCPEGEHDEVCHCGDGMDRHSYWDNHSPASMGCHVCHAGPEELAEQRAGR